MSLSLTGESGFRMKGQICRVEGPINDHVEHHFGTIPRSEYKLNLNTVSTFYTLNTPYAKQQVQTT